MAFEELAYLDFGEDIWVARIERSQRAFQLQVLIVLNCDISIIRSSRCRSHVWPEVDIIEAWLTFGARFLLSRQSIPVLALSSLWIVIIENIQVVVPRSGDEVVLMLWLAIFIIAIEAPVNEA